MILSNTVGSHAQMDLIDMSSQEFAGYKWILRYHDHHSGFAHVGVLHTKTAKECGKELIKILSTAIVPEVLQSDNGGEFLGDCIRLINANFPGVHVVKGRARHPQSQGGVERGNAPFKEALQKWMQGNGKDWTVGVFMVNAAINQCTSRVKGEYSPYSIYYGQKLHSPCTFAMGETAKIADTEYGIQVAKKLLQKIKKMEPEPSISTDDLEDAMAQGDELFFKEEKMTDEEKQQSLFFAEREIDRLVARTLEHLGFEKKRIK